MGLHVDANPCNMHPYIPCKTKTSKATTLLRKQDYPDTYFAYASQYPLTKTPSSTFAAVVTNRECVVAAASLRTSSIATVEAVAIALALQAAEVNELLAYILTDSQDACRLHLWGVLPVSIIGILGWMAMNEWIAWLETWQAEPRSTLPQRKPLHLAHHAKF